MLKKKAPGRKLGIQTRHKRVLPRFLVGRVTGANGRPAQALSQNQQFPAAVRGIFGASIAPLKVPV